ncbi:MAG TPA: helix-hairpin-helix domain-containing protein, partial [Kofleriaceae bacterium]|nr:helix-hairpin-helix domain-containing protein [Kofleriaceae bacterium]
MTISISKLTRRLASFAAIALLVAAMGGHWTRAAIAAPSPQQPVTRPSGAAVARPAGDAVDEPPARKANRKEISGKLNLNTATEEQLMMLPTVGPAKAERIVTWRKKNGGFKRVADLRH